jgi:hypothetical protein
MNPNSTVAEVYALYRVLGQEAFIALMSISDWTEERMLEMAAQVNNLPVMGAEQVLHIRTAVASKGRIEVKHELLNAGHSEQDVELAFQAAGV